MRRATFVLGVVGTCTLVACALELTTIGTVADAHDSGAFVDGGIVFKDSNSFVDGTPFADGSGPDGGWSVVATPSDVLHFRALWLAGAEEPWVLAVAGTPAPSDSGFLDGSVDTLSTDASADVEDAPTEVDGDATSDADSAVGGVVLRREATGWAVAVHVPIFEYALWGSTREHVWIVGTDSLGWADGDAGAYTSVALPDGFVNLDTIWGIDANHVWASGTGMLHWEDSGWSDLTWDGSTDEVTGLWGSSDSDVWAVSVASVIRHWDGSMWTSQVSGVPYALRAVWGSGANDVWIVGDHGTILRGDGSHWSSLPSGIEKNLYGVSGSSNVDVWIVGEAGTIIHWNGHSRSSFSLPGGDDLKAVAAASASVAWALGDKVLLEFRGGAP